MSSEGNWVWDPHRHTYVYFDTTNNVWRHQDGRPVEGSSAQAATQEEGDGGEEDDGADEDDDAGPAMQRPRQAPDPQAAFYEYQYQQDYQYSTGAPAHSQYIAGGPTLGNITEDLEDLRVAEPTHVTDDAGSPLYLGSIEREPKHEVTDPSLYRRGLLSRGKIKPTPGDSEWLDAGFKRQRNPKEFFVPGKIFRILWPEQPGARTDNVTVITDAGGMRGANVITKFRWFVVVKSGVNFCSCLPISTYQRRGVTKPSLVKSHHSVIYSGRDEPRLLQGEAPAEGEKGMMQSIRVVPRRKTEKMDPTSRVDYSRIYTVDHFVKVKDFGEVHEKYVKRLRKQWWLVFKQSLEISDSEDDGGEGKSDEEDHTESYKEWVTATTEYDGRDDTMVLEVGDQIAVIDYVTESWWKGLNTRTNVVNVFPASYTRRATDHTG